MLDILIKNIIIYDDKIEIHYNYVSDMYNPDGNDHRDFCFDEKICNLTEVANKYKKAEKSMLVRLFI